MREFEDALYGVLAGDSTLLASAVGGVWKVQAAQGTALPYVWMNAQSPFRAVQTFSGTPCMEGVYLVRGVVDAGNAGGMPTVSYTIQERIHTLIENTSPTLAGGKSVMFLRRDRIFDFSEMDPSGRRFQHLGGLYRVWVSG